MVEITLDTEKFKYLSAFATLTGISPADCEIDDDKVVYYIPDNFLFTQRNNKDLRLKLRLLENVLKKKIILRPFSFDPKKFAIMLLRPARVVEAYYAERDDGSKILRIRLDRRSRIPQSKIKKMKELIKKYFPELADIIVQVG